MKRNILIIVGLVILSGFVYLLASGQDSAVAQDSQPVKLDPASPSSETAVNDIIALQYKATWGVTEEPYLIDTGHHNGPNGVMVDAGDNLWVTESNGSRVLMFDSSGVYQQMLGRTGIARDWGIYLVEPVAAAVDSSGNAWVSDRGSSQVKKYDSGGSYMMQLGMCSYHSLSADTGRHSIGPKLCNGAR